MRNTTSSAIIGLLLLCCGGCYSGTTVKGSIVHAGVVREFLLYVPKGHTGASPAPLLINLHGYTSDADEQMWYGDFRAIADTERFIIVHPQGTKHNGKTHWNTGGWTPDSTVDDLGFVHALLDDLVKRYAIDPARIYAAGMSNGGEMSYHLACDPRGRVAAIASVGGSMTPETHRGCRPSRPVPVLHIHGTADAVVPYQGDATATPIDRVMEYWVRHNRCQSAPIVTLLPDINPADKSTVEHTVYGCGPANVERFTVIGGGHAWPGSAFKLPGNSADIKASAEIWKFFTRYDLGGARK